jgi:hypothetical protein
MSETKTYTGGCHCQSVRYEVEADLSRAITCNCSICSKTGTILSFVPEEQFKLLSGEDRLVDYQFNTKNIHHLFCSVCGIRSFTRGTGLDGKRMCGINIRCLDDVDLDSLKTAKHEGKHI